ncbi:MAG: hypothetical protein AMJ79_13210, partial [Phycisphaerae bacterium SM23_30]
RGIFVGGGDAYDNTLTGNTLSNNSYGIVIANGATNNTVTGNTVSNNGYGIHLYHNLTTGNQIYHNNFIDNGTHAFDAIYEGANIFNLDIPEGGNYWSGWTTPDLDGDGFVDYPYVFNGGQDNLPWDRPFGTSTSGDTPIGDEVPVDLIDPESGDTLVTLDFDNVSVGGISTLTATTPSENQVPPEGFKVGQPPTIFNIETTATFTGTIEVSINYSSVTYQDESVLRLFHFEDGVWIDITTNLNTIDKIITGVVTSLSPFAAFELDNRPPQDAIISPASGTVRAVNDQLFLEGVITDPDINDSHTAFWTVSNENWNEDFVLEGTVTVTELGTFVNNTVSFPDAGIYNIKLTVTDATGETDETTIVNDDEEMPAYVVIYNPEGGFVTGGGWIYSPAGALLDSDVLGKANFGFVAKYKIGATEPTGNTEFKFKAGDFHFKSSSYEWLVVAGTKAMFKGEGFIEDWAGNYKFMLTAIDSNADKFRMKIWNPLNDEIIYDNKRGEDDEAEPTIIGGGSIVIHKN